ncbi:MAG: ATP-binding protein [Thermomicrobiales bacterium]
MLVGRCYDLSETPPYGPWRELFDRAPRGEALPTLPAAVLPSERDGEVLTSQEDVRRCLFHFAALATARPVAVLLDDVHWADPASLDLLRRRAGTSRTCRCSFSPRTAPDEASPDLPLHALLPALVREARPERLDLLPWTRRRSARSSRCAMRRPTRTATASWATSSGAPRERALPGRAAADLGRDGARRHRAGELGARESGAGVGAAAAAGDRGRLARLGGEDRRLAVAAIIGQEPLFAVWAAVGAVGEDALHAMAERAPRRGVLEPTEAARFTHGAGPRRRCTTGCSSPGGGRGIDMPPNPCSPRHPDPDAVAYHFRQANDPRAFP